MGPGYHITPARNFGLFESPEAVVSAVFKRLGGIADGQTVLEPSAGRGRLADEARRQGGKVHCVEIQNELCTTLREKGHKVTQGDFLRMTPAELGQFDIVVMNPPFDRGRDCDHVRHALQFLKPGGRLVSVMAAGVDFREGKRAEAFRAMVMKQKPIDRWDRVWTEHRSPYSDLPAGSFKDSGTMVNTLTLALRKPETTV
jgi:predicted RNA methylase